MHAPIILRRESGERGRQEYYAFMRATHQAWRKMTEAEKQPYKDQAAAEPLPLNVLPQNNPNALDMNTPHAQSPWGIGSAQYPCSSSELQRVISDLVPQGRQSLSSAFAACGMIDAEDQVSNCVVRDRERLAVTKLRAFRKKCETCYLAHPGLCVSDSSFSSIIALQKSMAAAIRSFKLGAQDVDGAVVFLFAGYLRKRDAERMKQPPSFGDPISADVFHIAFRSGQPDKRKSWMSFTRCYLVGPVRVEGSSMSNFNFNTWFGMEGEVLDEYMPFAFPKLLRGQAKYWHVHHVLYEDDLKSPAAMKALGILASAPCYGVASGAHAPIEEKDIGDALEAAIDMTLSGPPKANKSHQDDPMGIDSAFDEMFGGRASESNASSSEAANDAGGDGASSASESVANSDAGPRANATDSDNISEHSSGGEGSSNRKPLRTSAHYKRDGSKVYWRNVCIGELTQWGESIACRCRMHSNCRSPASKNWGTDNVLIDWLLGALKHSGELAIDKGLHQSQAAALATLAKAARARDLGDRYACKTQRVQTHIYIYIYIMAADFEPT